MPPWKPYYNPIGATTDDLASFLDKAFGAGQQGFRKQFTADKLTEAQARGLLADNGVYIPEDDGTAQKRPIRIMIVDVENAKCWHEKGKPIHPQNDLFYMLVIPPVPQKYDPEMQKWESAWYHAIVDGYGM